MALPLVFSSFCHQSSLLCSSTVRGLKPTPMRTPMIICSHSTDPTHEHTTSRRHGLLFTLLGSSLGFTSSSTLASAGIQLLEEQDIAVLVDPINAYSYAYPLKLPGQSLKCSWVQSRKPERYSSAAPLSSDARLRIVSELLDIKDNIVISVSIGPPSPVFLKTMDKGLWDAKDVARSVLSDRSTARMTTGQRIAELEIVNAYKKEVDDQPYWYYEYLVQKSPTLSERRGDVYRHSLAVTAERDGYLYSLNISTLQSKWGLLQPILNNIIASFQMLSPTKDYVPPYKDPWRFW